MLADPLGYLPQVLGVAARPARVRGLDDQPTDQPTKLPEEEQRSLRLLAGTTLPPVVPYIAKLIYVVGRAEIDFQARDATQSYASKQQGNVS